ncbi:MAG: hypothetical protein V1894_05975 [Chloroflexota bacterium]
MRDLTETLLGAQKKASGVPYVSVTARDKTLGVANLSWERLYSGGEPDFRHAVVIPEDGSLIRFRVGPQVDSYKLYRQRVVSPGPGSDFSGWTYLNQYGVLAVASCARGDEVSVFWVRNNRAIYQQKSTDSGASWGTPVIIDYSPGEEVYAASAVYKPNGDLALFFNDASTLWVKKCTSGVWQDKAAWDKTTGDLSGIACVHDEDFNLLLTGRDSAGNYKLWSLIYGDGADVPSGTWSDLKEIASAPSGGGYEYAQVFMVNADTHRAFFTERFSGTQAYSRPFRMNLLPDTLFLDSLWREAVSFDAEAGYGLALAGQGDYLWLTNPSGVWRAKLEETSLDLTPDVISLKLELGEKQGRAAIELRNDDGRYASPGSGALAQLRCGAEISVSPGYRTSLGAEVSPGLTFALTGYEHTSSDGKASLILHAEDGWGLLTEWTARCQMRWNKETDEMSVKDLIGFILAKVGLRLEVKSQSEMVTGYFPDFTIHPGNRGSDFIRSLLAFVPDLLFIEGGCAYLVNPETSDTPVYSYGASHPIFEGHYLSGQELPNRVLVEGYDPVGASPIVSDVFSWAEIQGSYDRLERIYDRNINTVEKAEARGNAVLRKASVSSTGGFIRTPVNCGQELYDVIDLTDSRVGLSSVKRRVMELTLIYNPRRGEYEQKLLLEGV